MFNLCVKCGARASVFASQGVEDAPEYWCDHHAPKEALPVCKMCHGDGKIWCRNLQDIDICLDCNGSGRSKAFPLNMPRRTRIWSRRVTR